MEAKEAGAVSSGRRGPVTVHRQAAAMLSKSNGDGSSGSGSNGSDNRHSKGN